MYDELDTYAKLGIDHEGRGVVRVDLWYPTCREGAEPRAVEVGLMDVRAADSIRIEYDFDRDGWSVKQAAWFVWAADDTVCDPDWREVAFVKAWARDATRDGGE